MKPLVRRLANATFRVASQVLKRVLPSHEYSCAPPHVVHRILLIRLDHIGDVVMTLPALRLLRQGFPDARIDVLVRPDCAALLDGNRDATRVLIYDTPRFPRKRNGRGRGAGVFRTLRLIRRLRRTHYDVAIDFRGDDIARLLARCCGAPFRLGPDRVFYEEKNQPNFSFLMTCIAPLPDAPGHAVEANCVLLNRLFNRNDADANTAKADANTAKIVVSNRFGSDAQREAESGLAPPFYFSVLIETRAVVEAKLAVLKTRKFAVIHAWSNDEKRNWTIESWAQVADFLIEKNDFDIVMTGTQDDLDKNENIIALMRCPGRARNAAGVFALGELPAFFERASLLVAVDTGPMHIAAFSVKSSSELASRERSFQRVPIVALFLPFLAARHHPCGQADGVVLPPYEYPGEALIQDIRVEDVTAAIKKKLSSQGQATVEP